MGLLFAVHPGAHHEKDVARRFLREYAPDLFAVDTFHPDVERQLPDTVEIESGLGTDMTDPRQPSTEEYSTGFVPAAAEVADRAVEKYGAEPLYLETRRTAELMEERCDREHPDVWDALRPGNVMDADAAGRIVEFYAHEVGDLDVALDAVDRALDDGLRDYLSRARARAADHSMWRKDYDPREIDVDEKADAVLAHVPDWDAYRDAWAAQYTECEPDAERMDAWQARVDRALDDTFGYRTAVLVTEPVHAVDAPGTFYHALDETYSSVDRVDLREPA